MMIAPWARWSHGRPRETEEHLVGEKSPLLWRDLATPIPLRPNAGKGLSQSGQPASAWEIWRENAEFCASRAALWSRAFDSLDLGRTIDEGSSGGLVYPYEEIPRAARRALWDKDCELPTPIESGTGTN